MGHDFRIADWLVQPQLNTVSRNGAAVRLEPKVIEVLVCLAQHAGEPVPKEVLLQKVWPNTFVTDDVLKRSISELRRLFEDDVRDPRIIQTIPKRGYRLLVPVVAVGDETLSSEVQNHESAAHPWRKLALICGSLAAFLISVLAVYFVPRQRLARRNADLQVHSIAVLPLQNLTGEPTQEYFSDGMTDALITNLAQIGSIRVISRTSSMQYKQTLKSLPEIAREMNVDGIVEGSIQRSGDRVRITAQLIHGPSDRHLWANTYEGNFRDLFALERDVALDIAGQVRARISPGDTRNAIRQINPVALEAYLQGNYHFSKFGRGAGVEEIHKSAEYFQRAVAADPSFAPAYLGLANTHLVLPVSSREDWEIAKRAVDNALVLDPNSADAWVTLAGFDGGNLDWTRADEVERDYRRAIALNPNHAEAHDQLCVFFAETGRLDDGLTECQKAQELDPANDHLSRIFFWRGEYDHAIAIARMMGELHPEDGGLHYTIFECFWKKENYRGAISELEKTLTLYGLPQQASSLEGAFVHSGHRAAIRKFAEEIQELQDNNEFYLPVNLADAYAMLGQNDRAFHWLEEACRNRERIQTGEGAAYIGVDPMLKSLHSDKRFQDLLHRLGLLPELHAETRTPAPQ